MSGVTVEGGGDLKVAVTALTQTYVLLLEENVWIVDRYHHFMFLVRRCPGCGISARFVCGQCWALLQPAAGPSQPTAGHALFVYDDLMRAIVLAAKNEGRRDLFRPLGRAMADRLLNDEPSLPFDLVTWIPASPPQRATRGFDQGKILARSVGGRLRRPTRQLLRRTGSEPQTGKSRAERLGGPGLESRGPVEGRILVVDDVRTTGGSLNAGASTLLNAGAEDVTMMALAAVA